VQRVRVSCCVLGRMRYNGNIRMDQPYLQRKGNFIDKFRHAWRGIAAVWKRDVTFRIELIVAAVVLAGMFVLPLSAVERGSLIIIIALVLTLEMINATFEQFIDYFHPHFSDHVKQIKDTLAGMVFVASLASVLVGLFIFLKPIFRLDEPFYVWLMEQQSGATVSMGRLISFFGSWQFIAALAAFLCVVFFFQKRFDRIMFLAGGLIGGDVIVLSLKYALGRARPPFDGFFTEWSEPAFPSGHAFLAVLFWLLIAHLLHRKEKKMFRFTWLLSLCVAAAVAVSRLTLGAHWLTDVVFGLLFGFVWFWIWIGWFSKLFNRWNRA